MAVWVALLRAVNVGGHRKVPMAELREVCEQAGLGSVSTFIASGNIVFSSRHRSAAAVRDLLATAIAERFGFEVEVVVRTHAQFGAAVEGLPFDDPRHVSLTFLSAALDASSVDTLQSSLLAGAELVVDGDHAYLRTPKGLGTPYLAPAAGRTFVKAGTSRNWRTVLSLLAMADDLADQPATER